MLIKARDSSANNDAPDDSVFPSCNATSGLHTTDRQTAERYDANCFFSINNARETTRQWAWFPSANNCQSLYSVWVSYMSVDFKRDCLLSFTRRTANTNQPTENQPTFNTCKSGRAHITCTTNDQHSSSSCRGAHLVIWTYAHHVVKHNDFCCFKGVTYVALTVCYKLSSYFTLICRQQRRHAHAHGRAGPSSVSVCLAVRRVIAIN